MSDSITRNLDIWTSALLKKAKVGRGNGGKREGYGIKKLRELILELAVRGKLVPQDSTDEPASALLNKIAKEKERLADEGEIRKAPQLPNIDDEEQPYELPNGWEWTRLQDVSSYIQRGKGPKYADFGKVRVVSQKCVQWSGFDLTQARYADDESLDGYRPDRFLQKGDLLWNSTGTGTVGRVIAVAEVDSNTLVADSHVTIIRPLMVSSGFLGCYIAAPGIQQRIEPEHENSLVSGTTNQVELNLSAVIELLVPVPPVNEQRRIVAQVDDLMTLCDQLEQQQTHNVDAHQTLVVTMLGRLLRSASAQELTGAWASIAKNFDALFTTEFGIDQIKQCILQLAVMGKLSFQNPEDETALRALLASGVAPNQLAVPVHEQRYPIPESWAWVRFGGVGEQRLGKMLDSAKNRGELKPYLRNTNVQWMHFDLDDVKEMRIEEDEQREFRLMVGDLLICEGGEPGRCAIWNAQVPEMYFQKALHRVRPRAAVLSRYLALNLQVDYGNDVLAGYFTGATIKHFTGRSLSRYPVAIPPLEEQQRIVSKVDELFELCNALNAELGGAQDAQVQLADAIVQSVVA